MDNPRHRPHVRHDSAFLESIERRDMDRRNNLSEFVMFWHHDPADMCRYETLDLSNTGARLRTNAPLPEGMTGVATNRLNARSWWFGHEAFVTPMETPLTTKQVSASSKFHSHHPAELVGLLFRVVTRANQWSALTHREATQQSLTLKHCKLVGVNPTVNRQVIARWL